MDDVSETALEDRAAESTPSPARTAGGLGAVVRRNRAVRALREGMEPGSGPERVPLQGVGARAEPGSVVVIDNEPDHVALTVLLLQAAGLRVVGSTDGSDAVALVRNAGGAVVVLDFMLTGMTGADVCRALRAAPETRDVRIVLLSATPERDVRRTCTQYDTYLSKPTSGPALFKAIETA